MDWNIGWLITGAAALLLGVINLLRVAFLKKRTSAPLMFCSLSLGAVTILEEYRVLGGWLEYGNLVLLQSVPHLAAILTGGLWVLIIINLTALIVGSKNKGR